MDLLASAIPPSPPLPAENSPLARGGPVAGERTTDGPEEGANDKFHDSLTDTLIQPPHLAASASAACLPSSVKSNQPRTDGNVGLYPQ